VCESSGGQHQRAAVAAAVAMKPRIMLFDEPTAALDKATGRRVIELLRRLAESRGITLLKETHDNCIVDDTDRIVRMEDGRSVEDRA
jgi:putative ABC transport system ATP-binding protein